MTSIARAPLHRTSQYLRRTLAITAVSAAAVLGLAGCGSEPPAGSAASEPAAEGATAESSVLTAKNFAERISAAQLKAGSTHYTTKVTGGTQAASIVGDMILAEDPSDLKMAQKMTSAAAAQSFELRLVDSIIYLSGGERTQNKFVAADLNEPGAKQFRELMDQSNPQEQMAIFAEALIELQSAEGIEELDGVNTRKYTLTIDTAKLLEGQGLPLGSSDKLPKTITYTMSVGADDLPRRTALTQNDITVETTFSQWGKPVTIEAPAADQILER